jgi:hypothetical protein
MHVRFLVTFNTGDAATSQEAREHVSNILLAEGFANQVGRWNAGLADWFVIGGRWSGELTRVLLDQKKLATVQKEFEEKHGWWLGGQEHVTEEQRREQMKEVFFREFPDFQDEMPFWRDQYREHGYEDDAMIVTQERYDRLLKAYEGQEDSDEHADLDWTPVSPEMVGNKWLVVVDYHT